MTNFLQQIPNSAALERSYWGTEVYAGTVVSPTFRMYGALTLQSRRRLIQTPDRAGDFFRNRTPRRSVVEVDGTYQDELSFEDLAILPRYSVNQGGAPVSDAESTPGYLSTYRPHASRIRVDTATVEHSHEGLVERARMLYLPEFTISGDADDADAVWKWSSPVRALANDLLPSTSGTATAGSTSTVVQTGAGWTVDAFAGAWVTILSGPNAGQSREIASNTADTLTIVGLFTDAVATGNEFEISALFTSGVTDRTREIIPFPGTKLYLDDDGANIGTTLISNEFISFSATYQSGLGPKRFAENVDTYAAKLDQGFKVLTGQVRLEMSNRRERDHFANMNVRAIRIEQTGSTIDSGAGTTKEARLDIYAAYWDDMTKDTRANNKTATFAFLAYVDPTELVPFEIASKHTMSALP